jgi:hypothetical protein
MDGVCLEGTSEDIEHIANQRLFAKIKDGIESTLTWMFQPYLGRRKS